jgi:hypothetical protein
MKLKVFLLALAASALSGFTARADSITYTYTGAPMVSAPGAFNSNNCAACSINGFFTVASLLSPTSNLLTATEMVTPISYAFTATGLGTFTQDNSTFNMFAAVQQSGGIYAFNFTISGPLGQISSIFYGSAFEFTDYYSGPGGSPNVYAQGNYNSNIWTMSDAAAIPEPPVGNLLLASLAMMAIARKIFGASRFAPFSSTNVIVPAT